ncbi:hypothetical protein EMIHUDRAFT_212003 [Emiliania huxleyi CCMP1516]|uniref:Uncharacterized protein n=2 Tax=Emiliania huxleyi TaxID=2903 RepID=A0A0D3IS19_EMIH1|nr:hypothetical protein EMIHUDRAFT_212003 [Emiliania huxleyi CCMP1516]EOD14054.1 hypothetical protein EMIHUDRAFT_212003 [Emiliania huxleyi CCMP1516]|eukprot:XP_005766483.1 hypothetical protein EMIHUDRAFT_212003 [Emiliania huxleyi CCMP1516]
MRTNPSSLSLPHPSQHRRLAATRSLVSHVIVPLEALGNTARWLGRIVVAAETEVAAPTQAAGFYRALQMLSRGFASGHDLLWTKSLTAWSPPADFGRTSAISRCERFATHNTPPSCVNDWAFAMPGPLFSRFVDTMRTCWRNTSHAGAHARLLGSSRIPRKGV